MFFQTINRSDPEKVFIVVKNSYATAAITLGQVVVFDYTTDCDGVGVTQPSTALLGAVAGLVADDSIAAGEYGLVQVYGHFASASVIGTTDVTKGHPLTAANAAFTLAMAATTGVNSINTTCKPFFVAGEAYTTTAAAAKKVFIRCL